MTKEPKFFFDTAEEKYIRSTWDFLKTNGFSGKQVLGVTTNPNALSKVACNDMETFNKLIPALCKLVTEIRGGQAGGVVYVQFPQMTMSKELMRKYIDHVVKFSDGVTKIALKIPPYERVLKMVPEFKKKLDPHVTGLADCGTALKCISYGVRYVTLITGRMEEKGIDAKAQVRYVMQANLGQTEVIAGSMRTMEGLAWVVEEGMVPTIGSRVFDQMLAGGAEGAKEFMGMWDKVKPTPREFVQKDEFAPLITQAMTDLSLSFFEQMDSLGKPLLKSFEQQ